MAEVKQRSGWAFECGKAYTALLRKEHSVSVEVILSAGGRSLSDSAQPRVPMTAILTTIYELIRCAGSRLKVPVVTLPLGLWGNLSDDRFCFCYST